MPGHWNWLHKRGKALKKTCLPPFLNRLSGYPGVFTPIRVLLEHIQSFNAIGVHQNSHIRCFLLQLTGQCPVLKSPPHYQTVYRVCICGNHADLIVTNTTASGNVFCHYIKPVGLAEHNICKSSILL